MNAKAETIMMYQAQYSTTEGEMWVNAGEFRTAEAANRRLARYRRAGNPVRVIRWMPQAEAMSFAQAQAAGLAEII